MALIAQALTTMSNVRLYLDLFTLTSVTSTETLTATSTAYTTYSFAHTDLALNYFGAFTYDSSAMSTALITIDHALGTVTFTGAMTATLTCASYKYYAWDYSEDKQLERLINSVSTTVQNYTGRKFIADTYTEYYKGTGRQRLVLNQYPINKITSVKVDSAALTAGTDYVTSDSTYLDRGIVFKSNGWTWYGYEMGLVGELTAPVDNIEVIYSAGYTLSPESSRNLPWDVEDAVISMVSTLHNEQSNSNAGLKRLSQGDLTYEWKTDSLIQQYASVFDAYKKRCF